MWITFYSHLLIYCGHISMLVTMVGRISWGFSSAGHIRVDQWERGFLRLKVINCLVKMRNRLKKTPNKHIPVIIACYLNYIIDSPHVHTPAHTHTNWYKDVWITMCCSIKWCTKLCLIPIWWILRLFKKSDPFDSQVSSLMEKQGRILFFR